MYTNGLFGQFYHVKSLMHDINPSVKIICFFLALLIIFFTNSFVLNLFLLIMSILMMLLTKVPIRNFLRIIYSFRYIYLLILIIFGLSDVELSIMFTYIMKVIIVLMYISLISFTTSTSELSYGIEKVIEPFNIFNLKTGGFSFMVTSILKFYPNFIINFKKCLNSGASRGIDYNHSGIKGRIYAYLFSFRPSLRVTINDVKKTKLECSLRLFNTKRHRTNINHNKVRLYDIILIIFHLLFILAYVLESGLL